MKKVLFIAYYFPPIGGGGVQRSAKFVKFLPKFGWQPYVITTTDPIDVEGFDESLLADVPPDTPIWRIPTPNPVPITRLDNWINRQVKPRMGVVDSQGSLGQPKHNHIHIIGDEVNGRKASGRQWALRMLRRVAVWPLWPIETPPIDRYLYWSLHIVSTARQLVHEQDIDVIYTTSQPWSVNLTGLLLKGLTGRPWVADFRDPWTGNERIYSNTGWRRALDIGLESYFLSRCEAVIATTPLQMTELKERCSSNEPKFHTITNGYDPDDFIYHEPPKLDVRPIKILHAGVIYSDTIDPLLIALERAIKQPEMAERLSVHLVGQAGPPIRKQLATSTAAHIITFEDQVTHQRVIEMYRESQILLLILGNTPHWSTIYTGKIFELITSGTPILAIAPDGLAANVVKNSGTGCVVHPADTERISSVLRQIAFSYDTFLAEYYHPNLNYINQFDRTILTAQLAAVFNEVAGASSTQGFNR